MAQAKSVIFSLLDTPAFGGAEQYMFSHLYNLSHQGYHIVLATNNPTVEKEISSRLTPADKQTFHIIRAPYRLDAIGNWKGLVKFFISLPYALWWCAQTLKTLKQHYAEVICLWPGFSDRLVFSHLANYFSCPLIWIEIGPLEPTFKKNFGFPKLLYRLAEKLPDHVITTSLFTRTSILSNSSIRSEEITLIYPSTRIFSELQLQKYRKLSDIFVKKMKIKSQEIIVTMARLAHENEIDNVITAFSKYVTAHKQSTTILVIIGDGPQREELIKQTKHLHLTERIRFTGFLTEQEKFNVLSRAKFFIFPRAWELDGFGMTTIEAMSLGIPVLTTDFGPQIEIVSDGKEGYRYLPHNSDDLAEYIAKVMDLKTSTNNKMRQSAKKRATYFAEARLHTIMLETIRAISRLD